jgi:hypothetical protein
LAASSFAPKDCHAGIKASRSGNEKREEKPRLADSSLATAASRAEMKPRRGGENAILTAETPSHGVLSAIALTRFL